jgi:hypothetical protein
MCVFMVRSRVKTERGSEVEAAIQEAFPAIAEAQPLEREGRAHRGSRSRFTLPPTQVAGSTTAMLTDTCGNLIQLTQVY